MRLFILPLTLTAAALLSGACGSSNQSKSDAGSQSTPTATIKQPSQSTATTPTNDAPPVAVAHGGAPPSSGPSGVIDTSALDKKIEQTEKKAKAPKATQADKLAAATAYLERANIFYSAGQPTLYKFALRDFRRALRYDPNNTDAREKHDQIVQIYQQMGRPVPDLGNEP
jgi:hypothetical protein